MTEGKPKCDIDDLLCQMEALSHLKGLRSVLGEEKFQSQFPELTDLNERLSERIKAQEGNLREALEKCGLPQVEEEISGEDTRELPGEGYTPEHQDGP